jgi:D-alanine-D-alanine ligase
MGKSNRRIQIVRSSKKHLSSLSKTSADAILELLTKQFSSVEITEVNQTSDLDQILDYAPDLVFLGMEFVPANDPFDTSFGNRIWLSDFLDRHGIAYTGSRHTAHQLGRDKALAKQRALDFGLKTSKYMVVHQRQRLIENQVTLNYPLFVKPMNGGGGQGIDSNSVVYSFTNLRNKITSITNTHKKDSIIEEYLPGREFSVAILKHHGSDQYMTLPVELIAPKDNNGWRLLSSKVKSADAEKAITVTDQGLKNSVETLAIDVFYALGARDYGRIDIRLDGSGSPHFLEANLIPSLIKDYGSFPKACALNMNMDYEHMIMHIVHLGMSRSEPSFEPEPANANNIRKLHTVSWLSSR